jgi:hypothetical protein
MENYDTEEWVTLYRAALVELEDTNLSGRIEAARSAILARLDKLQNMPGLHPNERQAIADALSGLRLLQHEGNKVRVTSETPWGRGSVGTVAPDRSSNS